MAITASDGFVGPWISEMLGEDAIVIPDEALKEPLSLDAMLTPCKSLIHINSAAPDGLSGRDDRDTTVSYTHLTLPTMS